MTTEQLNLPVVSPLHKSVYCAACGRELTDELSMTLAMGSDCRAMHNYRHISALTDAQRVEMVSILHGLAGDLLRGEELRGAVFRVHELGFPSLSKRLEQRLWRSTIEVQEPVPPPPAPAPKPPLVLPFKLTAGQEASLALTRRVASVAGHACGIIVGFAGTGKAQPLHATVYTPSGPRRMGDIRVGDWVCTPSGGRARVAGVFPQGVRKVWRFTLEDDQQVESCEEHLWVVKDRTRSSNLRKYKIDTRRLTTADIAGKVNTNTQGHARFYLPMCAPLDFDVAALPIEPYLLGLLLGDGVIGPQYTLFSCARGGELAESFKAAIASWGHTAKTYNYVDWRVRGGVVASPGGGHKKQALRLALEALGLWGRNSRDKFVPSAYLHASVEQRRALLQGLMDTDGTAGKDGVVSFCSISLQLVTDVMWLVRSLGGRPSLTSRTPTYTYKGTRRSGQTAYNVHIAIDDTAQLFRLAGKRARCRARAHPVNRAIRRAELVGDLPVQCILVDDPAHLYVTDGVTPTHNTTLIKVLAHEHGTPMVITPTGKAALRVREATGLEAQTIHRWIYKPTVDPKTGVVKFARREGNDIEIPQSRMVILDEASMVGPDIWKDVRQVCDQRDLKLIVIGDGFQLPPVQDRNAAPFSVLTPAFAAQLGAERVEMNEVLRQAQDSPVIRASMALRAGWGVNAFRELERCDRSNFGQWALNCHKWGGVTICHRNTTRYQLNAMFRQSLGIYDEMPQQGEPLLVLKNAYEIGLVNGESINFGGWTHEPMQYTRVYDRYKEKEENTRFGGVKIGENSVATLSIEELHGRLESSPVPIEIAANRWARTENVLSNDRIASHVHANFGYVYTGHKSQGSQWPGVIVVIENSVRLDEEDGRRWSYTAITRAQHKAAVCTEKLF